MDVVLNLGIMILLAYTIAFFARRHVPSVLTYILVGLILGRSVINFVAPTFMQLDSLLSTLILAFIAFEIGDTFRWDNIKQLGAKAVVLSVMQAVVTTLVVSAGLSLLFYTGLLQVAHPLPVALLLGATAAATAPAATFMVVKEMRAGGVFTNYLLMAVTLDDAVGIIIFDFCTVISRSLLYGGGISISDIITAPMREIGYSALCGVALGIILTIVCRYMTGSEAVLITSVSIILIAAGLSTQFGFSPLLSTMVLGAVLQIWAKHQERSFSA